MITGQIEYIRVASNQTQISQHSGLSVEGHVRGAPIELIQADTFPVVTLVAGHHVRQAGFAPAHVLGVTPGGATLHVKKFGNVASHWFSQKCHVKVAAVVHSLGRVQVGVHTLCQLRPVRMQTTLPTRAET